MEELTYSYSREQSRRHDKPRPDVWTDFLEAPSIGTVTVEQHVATGNGVPFAPRHVYWVRARQAPWSHEIRTVVYSLTVANRLAEEQMRIWRAMSEMALRYLATSAARDNVKHGTPTALL